MFGLFQMENFFFVSLAIIFVLVILLVYLFKQRINSIETNETSMFGLLQKVVNEVKDLKRRVFCSGAGDKEEDGGDDDALDSNNIQQMATEDDHIQYEIIEVNLSPTSPLVKESATLTGIDEEEEEEDAEDMDMDEDAEDNDAEDNDNDMDAEDAEDMDDELSIADYNDLFVADADDEDMDVDTNNTFIEADKPSNDDLIDVSVIGDEEEDIVLDVEDFNAASSTTGMDPIHDTPSLVKDEEEVTFTSTTSLKKMHIHELRRMAIAKGCLPDVVNKMKKSEILRLL